MAHLYLVAGIRKVGKTTVLRQLEAAYAGAAYIDFTVAGAGYTTVHQALSSSSVKLLLLDEVALLDDFEQIAQHIYDMTVGHGRKVKVIMTGSSSAHISRLHETKLGGGRSRLFRLPPIMFVEYLYMTDKIPSYSDYSAVSNEYFEDYLLLKGLNSNLKILFDGQYLRDFYTDVYNSNRASGLTSTLVELGRDYLQSMADLVAYKLSERWKLETMLSPNIGGQELRSLRKQQYAIDEANIDLSAAIITGSQDIAEDISYSAKSNILSFLLWAGVASIEFTKQDSVTQLPQVHDLLGALRNAATEDELKEVFKSGSICFTSPLFYTRLGKDIFYRMQLADVDIYCKYGRLLCEVAKGNKHPDSVRLGEYFKDTPHIRVLTTEDESAEPQDGVGYYKIPYAKFCCMLDTGDVFKLMMTTTI
ncbi:MAG: AAA family ATPase [Firmicutes bacterium]|nr:AAA family ATPase [Bacillota bacterium]